MKVGYIHFYGLGDNIFALEPLFALKAIFKCEVIVFGNAIMENLLLHCDFVDFVHDIQGDIASHIDLFNSYNLDYAILTNCKRCYLYPLQASNVKTIITTTKIPSLFSMRCKTIPTHLLPKYRNMTRYEQGLSYVRKINPKLFDTKIKTICLNNAKVKTTQEQKERVKSFIANHAKTRGGGGNSKLILINPFSHTATHTLPLESYIEIIAHISNMQNCIPIVATYPQIHDYFLEALSTWKNETKQEISNLIIFQNDDDILNLAALIEQMDYVISPSTGTIHLASNLGVPTIGLFSAYDTKKWGTKSKQYVILPYEKTQMNENDIQQAITQTLHILQDNIRN